MTGSNSETEAQAADRRRRANLNKMAAEGEWDSRGNYHRYADTPFLVRWFYRVFFLVLALVIVVALWPLVLLLAPIAYGEMRDQGQRLLS